MNILIVEDNYSEVSGLVSWLESRSHHVSIVRNFGDAAWSLQQASCGYDAMILDLMLPWGQRVPEATAARFSEEQRGLYLVEAMKGKGKGSEILRSFGISIGDRYAETPIIVLSKALLPDEALIGLGVEELLDKACFTLRDVLAALRRIEAKAGHASQASAEPD